MPKVYGIKQNQQKKLQLSTYKASRPAGYFWRPGSQGTFYIYVTSTHIQFMINFFFFTASKYITLVIRTHISKVM